jgi:hypothetical protein
MAGEQRSIDGALTDGRFPIYITSFPDKTEEYDREERVLASHITEPVDEDILEKVARSSLFRQAYAAEGLTPDAFDAFFPVVVTLASFSEAYDEIKNYLMAQ